MIYKKTYTLESLAEISEFNLSQALRYGRLAYEAAKRGEFSRASMHGDNLASNAMRADWLKAKALTLAASNARALETIVNDTEQIHAARRASVHVYCQLMTDRTRALSA